ncbi:cortical protein marker for cell polarity-domain-containing protein [Phycomyces blakesleeanus]
MIGSTSSLARQSTGNAWWNLSTSDWSANTPLLSGTIYGAFQIDNNLPTSYYIGSINNAQQFQSQGLTFIDGSSTLSTLPFYPDASKPVEINAGALWKNPLNNGTWSTVVAGNFELNNGIYNTAIYDNGVWSGLGSNWKGNVTSMAVHDNFLYMSGEFDANDFTASNFAVYNLVDKSFVLYPELHTLDGTMAKVNVIRPNSIASGIVVGGDFSVAGNVTCKGVCALNPLNHLWTSFGDGISGTVQDMTFTEKTLVVTGDLKISDAVVSMAEYNYQTSGWSSPVVLPGPCSAISYDDGTKNTYIAGKDSSTAYLGIWDGSLFTIPNSTLGPGSVISQMTTVQISSNNSESSSLKTRADESDDKANGSSQILLVSGILNLNQYGNVSFALFDGTAWIPYIVSSSADGSINTLGNMFFDPYEVTVLLKRYLSQGLVIFISVAAGFGIVFVIIAIALSMLFLMRAKENNISPSANPLGYYGKPPRSPQSLIDMLESDKDPKRGSIGTYFDSRFSTMSRNGLTGREMMQTITSFGGSTDGLSATSTYVMPPQIKEISNISQYNHIRPDSSVRPQSELHRISDYSTFNGYGEPMENITPNNYNPFRASAIGIAVTADKPNGPTSSGDYVSRNSNMPSQPSFLNIAPPNTGVFTTQSQVTSNSVSFSSLVPVPASVATAPASSALNLSNLVPTTGSVAMTPVNMAGQAVVFGKVAAATATAATIGIAMSQNSSQQPKAQKLGYGHTAIYGNIAPGSTGRAVQTTQKPLNGQHVTYDNTAPVTATRVIVSSTEAPYGTPSPSVEKFVSRPLPQPQANIHVATFGNVPPAAASAAIVGSISETPRKPNDIGQSVSFNTIYPSVATMDTHPIQSKDVGQAAYFGNVAPIKSTIALSTSQSETPYVSSNAASYSTVPPGIMPVSIKASPQPRDIGQQVSYGNIKPSTAKIAINSFAQPQEIGQEISYGKVNPSSTSQTVSLSPQSRDIGQAASFGSINPSTATMVVSDSSSQAQDTGRNTSFNYIVPSVSGVAIQHSPHSYESEPNVSFGTTIPSIESAEFSTPQKVGENTSFGSIIPLVAVAPVDSSNSRGEEHINTYNNIQPTPSPSHSQNIGQSAMFSSIKPALATMTISPSVSGDHYQRTSNDNNVQDNYLSQSHEASQTASFGTVNPDITTTENSPSMIYDSHDNAQETTFGAVISASTGVGIAGLAKPKDKNNEKKREIVEESNVESDQLSRGNVDKLRSATADTQNNYPRLQKQGLTTDSASKAKLSYSSTTDIEKTASVGNAYKPQSETQGSLNKYNNATPTLSGIAASSLQPSSGKSSESHLDTQSATVRRTKAGTDSSAMGVAMVVPIVVAENNIDSGENDGLKAPRAASQLSLAPNPEQVEPSSVRWTNYSTTGALGTTRIDHPTFSMYSDDFSIYTPPTDNIAPLPSSISEGFASDPDFIQWTNSTADTNHSKQIDEKKISKNGENSLQSSTEVGNEENEGEEKEKRSTGVSSYQAGLDHTSMVWREDLDTLFRNSQNSYSDFQGFKNSTANDSDSDSNNEISNDKEENIVSAASGTSADIYMQNSQQPSSYDSTPKNTTTTKKDPFGKMKQAEVLPKEKFFGDEIMNSGAFEVDSARTSVRWSNIADLPPINTNFTSPFENLTPKSAASLESPSLRWKVAQIASPVETAHAPLVTESFANIHNVHEQADPVYDSESDSEFGDTPSAVANPVKARMVSAVNFMKPFGAEINPVKSCTGW